jgi:hypothetical protein
MWSILATIVLVMNAHHIGDGSTYKMALGMLSPLVLMG